MSESPQETFKSFATDIIVVWEWQMMFLPGKTYFISLSIKADLLQELLINRGFLLGNSKRLQLPELLQLLVQTWLSHDGIHFQRVSSGEGEVDSGLAVRWDLPHLGMNGGWSGLAPNHSPRH